MCHTQKHAVVTGNINQMSDGESSIVGSLRTLNIQSIQKERRRNEQYLCCDKGEGW